MPGDWDRVPEPDIVLLGGPGYSPMREGQRPRSCSCCGSAIQDGERTYCAGCGSTGFESELAKQRARAQAKAGKRKQQPAKFRPRVRLTKADVRMLSRTAEGRAWLREQGRLAQEETDERESATQPDMPVSSPRVR